MPFYLARPTPNTPQGNVVRASIEFDPSGRRTAYYFYKQHPGERIFFPTDLELMRVPAAEVMHHGGQSSIQQWDDAGKAKVVLDGIYRAIAMHRNRIYIALLHGATLNALRWEWLARRVRGRATDQLSALIAYHRQAFSRCMWE